MNHEIVCESNQRLLVGSVRDLGPTQCVPFMICVPTDLCGFHRWSLRIALVLGRRAQCMSCYAEATGEESLWEQEA